MIDEELQPLKRWFEQLDPQSFSSQDLIGQSRWLTDWTPVRTSWTDVGTPVVTGRYRIVGRACEFQVKVVPGTTIATTAGTSYIGLPVAAAGLAGEATMQDITTNVAVGVCVIDTVNSRAYVPTQGASGDTFVVAGKFEV